MVNSIRSQILTLKLTLGILTSTSLKKFWSITVMQVLASIFDLLGVIFVGAIGSLAVTGVSSTPTGTTVQRILAILRLSEEGLQHQVLTLALIATSLFFAKSFFAIYLNFSLLGFLAKEATSFSRQIFAKILSNPRAALQSKNNAVYLSTQATQLLFTNVIGSISTLIADSVLVTILVALLFFIDPIVGAVSIFLFGGVTFFLYQKLQIRMKSIGNKWTLDNMKSMGILSEAIDNFREIVVLSRRGFYLDKLTAVRSTVNADAARLMFMPNISRYILEFVSIVGVVSVAAILFSTSTASHAVAVLTLFLAASSRIAPALLRVQSQALVVKLGIGQTAPLMKLRSDLMKNEVSYGTSGIFTELHTDMSTKITLKNINFSYELSSNFELRDIEFVVERGQFLAIIGPSGGGKSTLVDLILGILQPTHGTIEIGTLNPSEFIEKFPGAIGYVPQVTYIAEGTLRENLTLGFHSGEIKDELLWDALRLADLENYVKTLPNSLDTLIGTFQGQLSGGQTQRLGIARALISRPKILILDEPTSSLDSESETRISEALVKLKQDLILVVVAHRISTIEKADSVIYLEDGLIKAKGDFGEVQFFLDKNRVKSEPTKEQ